MSAGIPRAVGTRFSWVSTVRAELTKTTTLRSWWIGVAVIMALNIYFAQMSASLLAELSATLENGFYLDFVGQQAPYERGVTDTILSSPYQSAALFLPLLVAAASGNEYRTRQILTSVAAVPSRLCLVGAKIVSTVLLSGAVVVAMFVVSDIILLLLLPDPAVPIVLSGPGILVGAKVLLYAVLMALFAEALTAIFRNTLAALGCIVLILVLAFSQVLDAIVPGLNNVLPMIGAKTFLFGYPDSPTSLTGGQGVILLVAWAAVAVIAWAVVFRQRDLT